MAEGDDPGGAGKGAVAVAAATLMHAREAHLNLQ
jgi:hypothetical protein